MKPSFITRFSISLFCFIALVASMSMGIFGAAGLCAYIWGPSILDTVLGDSPDRSHPAFITFLLVMVPGMLIGAIGGVAGVLAPLFSYFGIRCADVPWFVSPASAMSMRALANRILSVTETGSMEDKPRSQRSGSPEEI